MVIVCATAIDVKTAASDWRRHICERCGLERGQLHSITVSKALKGNSILLFADC